MRPGQVRVLIDKYEVLLKVIDRMEKAVERSKEPNVQMMIKIMEKDRDGIDQFPIEFNLELGQALYQAKLDKCRNELEEMKKIMGKWSK
ncbi:hypothetical protein KAR91_52850 [Candidatus Pacearchaeota archaeon]|nr:hypothetical protein [Candidatus Pacearchaeota archaeon]